MSWTVCILEMVRVHPERMKVFGSVNRSRSTSLCVWGGVGIVFFSVCAQLLSRVQLFGTPWPAAHQPPVPMEFSRKKYWSGLPYLLQGIFLTQESSPHLQSPPSLASPSHRRIPYHWATFVVAVLCHVWPFAVP